MVQDYVYTKPRGPIAAMYSSPGPCYALPSLVGHPHHDPRSSHSRGPAFPFGTRHGKITNDCSPGPVYLPNPKVQNNGKDGLPHFSLYGRLKEQAGFNTPGPGAYKPEHAGPCSKPSAPRHSLGGRTKERSVDDTPGQYEIMSFLLIWQRKRCFYTLLRILYEYSSCFFFTIPYRNL
jgi:hypothetical protein